MKMITVNVFVNKSNQFGNPVGIIVDERNEISQQERQLFTKKSGYSEVVFVENIKERSVKIYNPLSEVEFAGHALVGTSYYFIHVLNLPTDCLQIKSGKVKTWEEGSILWIQAENSALPPWNSIKLLSIDEVENYSILNAQKLEHTMVWAWKNEELGEIRARTFASDWGIPEDEANGSGAMVLSKKLSKKISVMHGKGSEIFAYEKDELCNLGGRVQIAEK